MFTEVGRRVMARTGVGKVPLSRLDDPAASAGPPDRAAGDDRPHHHPPDQLLAELDRVRRGLRGRRRRAGVGVRRPAVPVEGGLGSIAIRCPAVRTAH
jgi:hypothetical protein